MNLPILRILDANFNRAREALRVVEDYARFVLDDGTISGELKQLRHDLAGVMGQWGEQAVLLRDTPGDVGRENKTQSELRREDMAAVVTAAGKRLGEALRTIEEYLKTLSPADATVVENIRYRFYDLELRVAQTLGRGARFGDVRLYVLITESICKRPWVEVARAAIEGGADCLQLREKELDGAELLARVKALVDLCRRHKVLCIVNDRADIAVLADADGVHVGQTDLPAAEARKLVGPDRIVGVSTHDVAQAKRAVLDGADYIGVGPVYRSATKTREILPGLAYAREAAAAVSIPTVAIAGIDEANIEDVLGTGVKAVAVTAAVAGCDDPAGAARRLKAKLVGRTVLSAQVTNERGGADILVCPSKPLESQFSAYGRRLPHWRLDGATYFVTFRIREGELTPRERTTILEHVRSGDPKFYTLIAAVIMPDHVHILLRPNGEIELARIMKGTKGVTARKVNDLREVKGLLWQDESWDRIMRNQAELDEKVEYCMNNAVKKGLVADPWDYPWWFYKPDRE